MLTEDVRTQRIIVNDLDRNLLVEAGAGTGKTYALVSRVAALVRAGVRMENIVAITFTEAAAAELSDRIRGRLEQLQDQTYRETSEDPLVWDGERRTEWDAEQLEHLQRAIAELDRASIQTIHSFAARLLRERPLDMGLPPGWAQWDELAASQDFARRWDAWLAEALGPGAGNSAELEASLRYLMATGNGISKWRELADEFQENCHRLGDADCLPTIDFATAAQNALEELQALAADRPANANDSDLLFVQLLPAIETVAEVVRLADDPVAAAHALATGAKVDFTNSVGAGRNWNRPAADVRDAFRSIGKQLRGAMLNSLLQNLRQHFAVAYERERKANGVATFSDLLVWARDLLRNEDARQDLRQRYQYILLDEFQDTDPLQAEIAFYLTAAAPPATSPSWRRLELDPGRLFIVGDPKQSIYRFRGADLGVTQGVQESGQLERLYLVANRRSQQPILEWVNAVFSNLMAPPDRDDGAAIQADYVPLERHDATQRPGLTAGVRVFGASSNDKAGEIRQREAADIAELIRTATAPGAGQLRVSDQRRGDGTRPAELRDVCILIPTRTGLGILENALMDARIPYRVEGGSLLFDTQEVRDLLNCLRAIDDPSDEVSVVAALRSPAFACSDVDLLRWNQEQERGAWNYRWERDGDGPVAQALAMLREYHYRRHDVPPSRLISDFIRDRRLDELDLIEYRPREAWRRRQFLVEQARTLETGDAHGDGRQPFSLDRFIRWAELQMEERSRISEAPVPETDDDAVRIMTIHAAKGLEFPVVFMAGLASNPRTSSGPVLFDSGDGSVSVRLGDLKTPGYTELKAVEEAHLKAEYVRLAYVAATRARDHLLVSMHRSAESGSQQDKGMVAMLSDLLSQQELPQSEMEVGADVFFPSAAGAAPELAVGEYAIQDWQRHRQEVTAQRAVPQVITATRIAGHCDPAADPSPASDESETAPVADTPVADNPIDNKEAEPDAERPWRFGRGGTAFGSALHGLLQDAVNRLLLEGPARTGNAQEVEDWLDRAIDRFAPRAADDDGIIQPRRVTEIRRLAKKAVRNEWVQAALQAERLWPEIPVAAELETDGGKVVIEGIIDLLYVDPADGQLVVLDYKSDNVSSVREVKRRMEGYQWQGAAYAYAVEKATGRTVKDVRFLFVRRDRAESIPNLRELMNRLPERAQGHGG